MEVEKPPEPESFEMPKLPEFLEDANNQMEIESEFKGKKHIPTKFTMQTEERPTTSNMY